VKLGTVIVGVFTGYSLGGITLSIQSVMPVWTLKIAGRPMHDYSFTPNGFFTYCKPYIDTSGARLMSPHIEMQLLYYLDGASKQKVVWCQLQHGQCV
jgi:hypothetical protein